MSHKLGGRLPLLSARPAVTPATLKRAATNFATWRTEAVLCISVLPIGQELTLKICNSGAVQQNLVHGAEEQNITFKKQTENRRDVLVQDKREHWKIGIYGSVAAATQIVFHQHTSNRLPTHLRKSYLKGESCGK